MMWVCRPVASFFLPSSNNNVERDCTTPDKSPGSCREITDCQTLGTVSVIELESYYISRVGRKEGG